MPVTLNCESQLQPQPSTTPVSAPTPNAPSSCAETTAAKTSRRTSIADRPGTGRRHGRRGAERGARRALLNAGLTPRKCTTTALAGPSATNLVAAKAAAMCPRCSLDLLRWVVMGQVSRWVGRRAQVGARAGRGGWRWCGFDHLGAACALAEGGAAPVCGRQRRQARW